MRWLATARLARWQSNGESKLAHALGLLRTPTTESRTVTYLLFRLLRPLAVQLPRSLVAAAAGLVGLVAYGVARSARRTVLRNLAVATPELSESARRQIAIRTFVHGALSYAELLALSTMDAWTLFDDVQSVGWEHLDAALARGRGVIMVGAHVGAPSTAGQILATRGVPATIVVEPMRPVALHRLMTDLRAQTGLRFIPIGRSALREMVAALRRNEIVGMMGDRDVAGSGEMLPFFGRPTRLTTAPATLALRTGAVIVPAVAYRLGPFRAAVEIHPIIEVEHSGNAKEDALRGTLRVAAVLEAFIRRHPEQWVVFSEVWPDT